MKKWLKDITGITAKEKELDEKEDKVLIKTDPKAYEKIEQFIKDQPRVTSKCQYRTSDGKIREINVSGFKDFFV